jgi:quercetin dioxygenase-like cupin family protein
MAVAQKAPVQHSAVFDWNSLEAKPNNFGSARSVFRGPTPTLEELEMHITTLNPGQTSHAPHTHPNEELIIIREGTVETLSNGKWVRTGPGSIIFNASNELHGLKNVGTTPATYHVINWRTASTPKANAN